MQNQTVKTKNNITVFFSSGESEDFQPETDSVDPLAGVGLVTHETEYYRINQTVFTDTLKLPEQPLNSDSDANQEEITFIGNVTVQKGTGKKNLKYHFQPFQIVSSKFVCPQSNCSKRFSTVTLLKAHVRKVHCSDRGRYKCGVCSNAFPARYLLRRHMAAHDGTKVECPVCLKLLSASTKMAQHIRTHEKTKHRRNLHTQTQSLNKE